MAISYEPRGLPRLRDQLVEFSKTDIAHQLSLLDEREGRVYRRDADLAESMRMASATAGADLYYITPEMCELAGAAARSLPDFELGADDPPSRSGLMWFAKPIADHDGDDVPIAICGVTWTVLPRNIRLALLAERDNPFIYKGYSGEMMRQLGFPPVFPLGHWDAPTFAEEDGVPPLIENNKGKAGHHVLAVIKTLWLLLRQPMTAQDDVPADRQERRRLAREGREPSRVRVIRLRRPSGRGSGEPGEPTIWHHRWIVRGHWRMQPHGQGRQQRRPVWIAPFVKGPEDAPMLGGDKVYVFDQPPA